jgi:RimJ/RimL family protein N-acetyltransferase
MSPSWTLHTGRLLMRPVGWADLPDLQALKSDPIVYAIMLGGVRSPLQAADELAADISYWGSHGVGMWAVRTVAPDAFVGTVGMHDRPDGRGVSLRFALVRGANGRGYASEAAGAALRFAHDHAGVPRVLALARESNVGSRQVLGAIGMVEIDAFERDGYRMLVYESVRRT